METKIKEEETAPRPRPRMRAAPRRLVAAMAAAGAQKEEVEGEDLRVLRIPGQDSPAWALYRNWACSLGASSVGEEHLAVQAVVFPTAEILASLACPPLALGIHIQVEANSVIHHLAPLVLDDLSVGGGTLALPDPLSHTVVMTKMQHAQVAVTAVVDAISNPGAKYPVINNLQAGTYICHVQYFWYNAVVTVPVFRFG